MPLPVHPIRLPNLAGRRTALEQMRREYGSRGFTTLALAMSWDPAASVAHFAATNHLPFGLAIDHTGTIARSFGDVSAAPTTFLIDRRGAEASKFVGDLDYAAVREKVALLLEPA